MKWTWDASTLAWDASNQDAECDPDPLRYSIELPSPVILLPETLATASLASQQDLGTPRVSFTAAITAPAGAVLMGWPSPRGNLEEGGGQHPPALQLLALANGEYVPVEVVHAADTMEGGEHTAVEVSELRTTTNSERGMPAVQLLSPRHRLGQVPGRRSSKPSPPRQ